MDKTNRKYLNQVPVALILSRLILGFVIVILAMVQFSIFRQMIAALILIGLITDIFDGIIARKLNISSQKLRRMDSSVDQVFWICCLIGAYLICPDFFRANFVKLLILIFVEGLTYGLSFIRFKKEVATHAISSKIWTITIMGTVIQVVLSCNSLVFFEICFWLGVISRVEIIAILLILKVWTNDVPSVYHAVLLRKGIEIKRNKLFNG